MKALLIAGLAILTTTAAWGHEVPDNVTIRVFMKPSGNKMQIAVRVPVNAMIDTLFPLKNQLGFLDIPASQAMLADATRVWVTDLLDIDENDKRLARPQVVATQLSRQSDVSFTSFAGAVAHIDSPKLPSDTLLVLDRGVIDVLVETPIASDRSDFAYTPRFGRLGVKAYTTVSFIAPDGGIREFSYEGDPDPYHLNPSWDQAVAHFIQTGFVHIVAETDHLLFLLCAVLVFRRLRGLLPFAIAFTAVHSLVLIASAFGLIPAASPAASWIPVAAITLTALSVVYLALEVFINGVLIHENATRRHLPVAVLSGIVFGAAFWSWLSPGLQFGGAHKFLSVISFNAGLEMGELLALALLIPATALFFKFAIAERMGSMILAGLTAHTAWHRMTERAFMLSRVSIPWPSLDSEPVILAVLAVAVAAAIFRQRLRPALLSS
jgi:HupE / UreJ protein